VVWSDAIPGYAQQVTDFLNDRLGTSLSGGDLAEQLGVLLAACSAVATTVFLALAGVPYPLALGLWVGLVSQFIPTVGTYLAGALPVLIALLDNPVSALWVLAFIVVYQQFENMILSPRISARTMALHPAVPSGRCSPAGRSWVRSARCWPCRPRPACRPWCRSISTATRSSPTR
jgi:hypothetical protein